MGHNLKYLESVHNWQQQQQHDEKKRMGKNRYITDDKFISFHVIFDYRRIK